MFRRTALAGLIMAMFAAQAPDAAALGAPDVCTWKGNFIAAGAMTTARAGLVATELSGGSVLVTGGSSRSTTVRSAVGKSVLIAGRLRPACRPRICTEAAIWAPVLPALTKPSASPSAC